MDQKPALHPDGSRHNQAAIELGQIRHFRYFETLLETFYPAQRILAVVGFCDLALVFDADIKAMNTNHGVTGQADD